MFVKQGSTVYSCLLKGACCRFKCWAVIQLGFLLSYNIVSPPNSSQIKLHLDRDTYQLCQDKLTEFYLSKEDGFRWCANVSLSSVVFSNTKLVLLASSHRLIFDCLKYAKTEGEGSIYYVYDVLIPR